MIKSILEFNQKPDWRFEYLKKIAEAKGWDFQFETQPSYSAESLRTAQAAVVDLGFTDEVLQSLSVLPTLCRNLAAVDSFFNENGTPYPRLIIYEALQSLLIDEASQWDNREPVFIVGDSELARVAAGAVAALGSQTIFLIGNPDKLKSSLRILQRFQLGIKFEIIPADELTSKEITGGLLINTVQLKEDRELFIALSYFNFLIPQAFVVDLVPDMKSDLLEEAQKAGVMIVEDGRFVAHWAAHWWRKCLGDEKALSPQQAFEIWNQFLAENPSSV